MVQVGSAWSELGLLPPPFTGRVGRGRASANLLACPSLSLPEVGEGTHRVRGKKQRRWLCEDERAVWNRELCFLRARPHAESVRARSCRRSKQACTRLQG